MRAPSSFGNNLPTVEDESVGSNSNRSMRSMNSMNSNTKNHNNGAQPRMKRSPYLSVMAGSTKESEDLVAMLSRPTELRRSNIKDIADPGGGPSPHQSGGGLSSQLSADSQTLEAPGGRSTFFNLKRPSSENPMGAGFDASSGHVQFATGQPSQKQQRPLPSLRSSLRMGSRTDMKAMSSDMPTANNSEIKKVTSSVTFSTTTKKASFMGINEGFAASDQQQQGNAGFPSQQQQSRVGFQQVAQMRQFNPEDQASNYSKASMMKKSQSIAAPQFMMAHQNSTLSSTCEVSANESFSSQGAPGGSSSNDGSADNNDGAAHQSFPIYFADLPTSGEKNTTTQQQSQQQSSNNKRPSPFQQASMRSKSTNTMQYYAGKTMQSDIAKDPAQKLLHAAGVAGPVTTRPSMNALNLTFRDMLDEGDGEGDLNVRSRNQQWKHFQSFSNKFESDNPMMQATMMEMDRNTGSTSIKEGGSFGSMGTTDTESTTPVSLSESKRTLTPSSFNSRNGMIGGTTGNKANASGGGMMPPRSLTGSHRGAVSVNDLAVLRRAAARINVNPTPNDSSSQRQMTTTLPGQTLGGGMLSRIPSSTNTAMSSGSSGEDVLSPLAQMMAKMNSSGGTNSGSVNHGGSGGGNPSGAEQQKELFLQMLAKRGTGGVGGNPAMSSHASSSNMRMGGMGRRVQTVGAGLAYGRGNMSTGKNGLRLSRFNLGDMTKVNSQLSQISSGGESGGGGGRNEEW